IHLKKMFGGYGVFEAGKMFAMIDKEGCVFFKADESNIKWYEDAGSKKHARMPYFEVPEELLADETALKKWAQASITVSKKAK
ncbi:MAG: TfoX/Sxy family protein, partial [Anaerolineaceae bacterium]|nr:TfoX/Sxy family protein [Anaerolineaceae bacterium]